MSLGTGFLSFIAGLQGLDRSLIEAGLIDGISNRVQELWYIVLPGMKPQLQFGAVMQIISAFSVSDISINLLGYPSTQYAGETIVTHITDVANNRYELGYACALATVLFLLMFLTNKLVSFILSRVGR
jgi:multiple sugar transport system permease protein